MKNYTDATTGVIRQGEYDEAKRHYQSMNIKFLEHKDTMLKDYQKAQGWLYHLLCASFARTNLTKIQIYEPNTFRESLLEENPTLTVKDLRIQFMSYSSLLWNTMKHEYVQTGSSSLIIQMSGWTTLTGVGFQEFLKKINETVTTKNYTQEAEIKWQRILWDDQACYYRINESTNGNVSVYASESLHSGVQDIFKELDNGQDMTVSGVSKKLHSLTQIEEAKETLHKSNGFKKKKGEFVLGVTSAKKTV